MATQGADQKARSEESALGALEGPSHAFDFPSGYTPLDVLGTTSSILVSHRPLKASPTLRATGAPDSCLYRVVVASTQAEARKVARADPGGCSSPEVVATVRVTDQFAQAVVVASTTVEFTSAGRLSGNTPVSISVSSGGRTRDVRVEPVPGRVDVSLS